MEEKKLCPYCGEEILAVAKKCKHCGEWLDKKENVETRIEPQYIPEKKQAFKKWWIAVLIILAVVIGLFVVLSKHQGKTDKDLLVEKTDPVINFAEPDEEDDAAYQNEDKSHSQSAPKVIVSPKTNEVTTDNYDTEELLSLGESYEKGIGVEEDHETAFFYYEKAAKTGNPSALNKLGNMYAQGKGCSKNTTKAANYYLKAAEKGNKYAQHNIAFCYWDGNGVEKDREKAVMWMRRSAAQGYDKAIKALKIMGVD